MAGIRIVSPGVIGSPTSRSRPPTLTPALHRITPSQSPSQVGQEITSIPSEVGNSISVEAPPVMRADPMTYGAFRGSVNGEDDTVRLAASPSVTLATFTTLVVARLKNVALGDGYTSLFYMMPPGGNRSDLTLWAPSATRVLRWSGGSGGQTVDHGWTPDTQWHVFTVRQTADAVSVGVDGVESTVEGPSLAGSSFSIGRRRGGGYSAVDVADAVIFPALGASAFTAEVANFANFYGVSL